ncbi:MAG: glycoside hydrolase family 99-like domain-containing protein [Acidimicrobiia bacterium]|nr:glycoside hydrolase family 99-like domain-containing protein [Acidimicrobiia bacterium]
MIAFYLPQYYPTPENDEWWGPGFTEWTNVARARPLFPGHRQPIIPGELGFYDLRNPETRAAQAELARAHGVTAFCYWHYWFGDGRRLLDRPFAEVLASGQPDFPFCLAWANDTWRGVWIGAPDRVLMEQRYPGVADERAHFDLVVEAFHDPRYVRIDGRPLFAVFNPPALPEPEAFAERWRTWADDAGLPGLFLVGLARGTWRASTRGFDGVVMSQVVPPTVERRRRERVPVDYALSGLTRRAPFVPGIYSAARWWPHVPHLHPHAEERSFPTVLPAWDNTPRSGRRGFLFTGATPERFAEQVRAARRLLAGRPEHERLLFVKSWNEWAEGNILEPDRHRGRGYLEALRGALDGP